MTSRKVLLGSVVAGIIGVAMVSPARTQTNLPDTIAAPDYSSDVSAGALSNGHFYTPESDGRPGVCYFDLGAQAFKKGDYRHAVDMYKVAASWAYKPAEYNLGLMYFTGQGVPVDRARGAAWMVLAAERGGKHYIRARDLMITALTKQEFARTDELWNQLKGTYGDAVALARAKAEWVRTGRSATGSHLGHGMGELLVGNGSGGTGLQAPQTNPNAGVIGRPVPQTPFGVFGGANIADGSIAYRQFQQSDNPYDPVFLKGRNGTVTVEALTPLKSDSAKQPPDKNGAKPPSSGSLE